MYYEEDFEREIQEQDVYEEGYLEECREADGISIAQEGFMVGYLADNI